MARQLPNNISFQKWVNYLFDHPASEITWYARPDYVWWNASANLSITVQYLTELFVNAGTHLAPFSNSQLNDGLWYVSEPTSSNHMRALFNLDNGVEVSARLACVRSIPTLYRKIFATRCSAYLSHKGENSNPLNLICYMWWDLLGGFYRKNTTAKVHLNQILLDVIGEILSLESMACRESALHGLGHWAHLYPEKVEKIIEQFLNSSPDISDDLRKYAVNAIDGKVR